LSILRNSNWILWVQIVVHGHCSISTSSEELTINST
jgi:hypothetical protein